jgi:PAS domain S-box-containing protein
MRWVSEMDEWRQFAELANPDGWFWQTDREHRFVWLSESFETVSGISQEELLGACRADINAPIVDDGDWEAHLLALENREPFRNFVFKPKKQQGQIWASISGTPIWDENGAFQGYRGLGHVLDGPIEPADRASTLAKVVDEVDATIAIWDGADRLVYYNETFLRYHSAIAHIISQPISYERCLRESVAAGIFPEEVDRFVRPNWQR